MLCSSFSFRDPKWRQHVALKVVRKVEHYVQDAEFEVSILEEVAHLDGNVANISQRDENSGTRYRSKRDDLDQKETP